MQILIIKFFLWHYTMEVSKESSSKSCIVINLIRTHIKRKFYVIFNFIISNFKQKLLNEKSFLLVN
jgi:hypothetical protein